MLGLAVLMRPTNVLFAVIFLFYKTASRVEVVERFYYWLKNLPKLLLVAAVAFPIFVPQLLYWKSVTGHWISYSYGNEGFIYWSDPKILRVLFDVQNGLFFYSPVLLFAMWGFWRMHRRGEANAGLFLAVLGIATYVFASWWAWWFGSALGHRCYVDYLPLFAFGLVYFFEKILVNQGLKKYIWVSIIAIFTQYALGCSHVYQSPWDGPDWTVAKWWKNAKQAMIFNIK